MSKKPLVSDLVREFDLEVVLNNDSLDREIKSTDFNRVGLELSGAVIYKELFDIVYLGSTESKYLKMLSISIQRKRLTEIFKLKPPLIIYGPNFELQETLLGVASKFDIPIIKSNHSIYDLNLLLSNWLISTSSSTSMIHGCLSSIFGVGTLIIGDSGIGKSELTIELTKRGHIFIADDAVDIKRVGNKIYGNASELSKDFIEIRGLGVLSFSKTFGIEKMIDNTTIEIVIELIRESKYDPRTPDRIGIQKEYYELEGKKIRLFRIPVIPGRNMADIVETAVANFKQISNGFDSASYFVESLEKKKKKK